MTTFFTRMSRNNVTFMEDSVGSIHRWFNDDTAQAHQICRFIGSRIIYNLRMSRRQIESVMQSWASKDASRSVSCPGMDAEKCKIRLRAESKMSSSCETQLLGRTTAQMSLFAIVLSSFASGFQRDLAPQWMAMISLFAQHEKEEDRRRRENEKSQQKQNMLWTHLVFHSLSHRLLADNEPQWASVWSDLFDNLLCVKSWKNRPWQMKSDFSPGHGMD